MPAPWMLGCNRPMGDDSLMPGRPSGLMDRQAECGALDQLINAVQAGGSRVLVVRGEPGVGKSALLDYLAGRAAGCWVVRAAGERPLVCVVDDEQWLDRASVQALGFAARRLAADPVGLVFAARVPGQELAALPELAGGGLGEGGGRALLDSA